MIKRHIQIYTSLSKVQNLPPILNDFPISFGSSAEISKSMIKLNQNSRAYKGLLQVYQTFFNSLCTNTLSSLEDALEPNFLSKTQSALDTLTSQGYKLQLTGDISTTKIYKSMKMTYMGSVLPFRNLILPLTDYSVTKVTNPSSLLKSCEVHVLDSKDQNTFEFKDFKDFDFKKANLEKGLNFEEKIKTYLQQSRSVNFFAEGEEYIIESAYKILVVDSDDKVVSLNEGEGFETHSVILETFQEFPINFFLIWKKEREMKEFNRKVLQGYLGQNSLIDFDGFMQGNPPIPKELLVEN